MRPSSLNRIFGLGIAAFFAVLGLQQGLLLLGTGQGASAGAGVLGQELFGGDGPLTPWLRRWRLLPENGFYHDPKGTRYFTGSGGSFIREAYGVAWHHPAQARHLAAWIAKRESALGSLGIRYKFMVVPDKGSVDPTGYPSGPEAQMGPLPRFRERLAAELEGLGSQALIDPLPELRAASAQGRLYRYQDHHFNPAGSRLAAEILLDGLGLRAPYGHQAVAVELPVDAPGEGELAGPEAGWASASSGVASPLRLLLSGDSFAHDYLAPLLRHSISEVKVHGRMNDLAPLEAIHAWRAQAVVDESYEPFLPWIVSEFSSEAPPEPAFESALLQPGAPIGPAWDWERGDLAWGFGALPREGNKLHRPILGRWAGVYLRDRARRHWLVIRGYCARPGLVPDLRIHANGVELSTRAAREGLRFRIEAILPAQARRPDGLVRLCLQRGEAGWTRGAPDPAPQIDAIALED